MTFVRRWGPLAAYLLVVLASAYGHWRLNENALDDNARSCVAAWEARQQIRQAIPIPSEAIIEVATDADPDLVEQLRQIVDRRIHDTFPDPDCDLEAALKRLDN